MSHHTGQQGVRPVALERGVAVHPSSDRRLATEHWLLSTLPDFRRERARMEWQEHRVTLLPVGTLFAAARLPGRLVQAVAASTRPTDIDDVLREALQGGPVICDQHWARYYALLPASLPTTWHDAVDDWRAADVEVFGRGTHLGVPRLDDTMPRPDVESYWSVPMESAAALCTPLRVARLIAYGRRLLADAQAAEDTADGATPPPLS